MTEPDPSTIPLQPVPDLSALPAADAGGQAIGSVYGSLAEADSGLIRYVDVALEGANRHVLVPIGHVRVVERTGPDPELRLRAAVLDDLATIPSYAPGRQVIDDGYERELLDAYGKVFYGDHYYAHPAYDHVHLFAGEHPIVRGPPARPATRRPRRPRPEPTLVLLSAEPDLDIAEGEPNIVGWPFYTDADLPSGHVRDLIVDPDSLDARYVVIDAMDGAGDLILPIGYLQINAAEPAVVAPGLRHDDLADIGRFDPADLSRASEDQIRRSLQGRVFDRRRYELPDYRDGRYVDRRAGSR